MKFSNSPTESELALLQALWAEGEASVQRIHERMSAQREVAYTTVLTQLQRMHKKGWVSRTKEGKQHLYRAALAREEVEQNLLSRLSDAVFGGSAVRLALSALGKDQPSAEELDELQRWLDEQKKQ